MSFDLITTSWDGEIKQTDSALAFKPDIDGDERGLLNLYPEVKFQELYGFGGAFTEATGYVLGKMPQAERDNIMNAYFGVGGIGYRYGRAHIDSCDFSLGNYSAVSDPSDRELNSFSLKRDEQHIIPFIKQAGELAGCKIKMMLSPWSPPAYMKTNGDKNHGGELMLEYYEIWAKYMVRYVQEYRRHGVEVEMLSLQNEPKATQTWDSCIYSAEQERDHIREFLAPAFISAGVEMPKLFIWDHNRERSYERATVVLGDDRVAGLASGVAVHWYSGDYFESLELLKKRFPDHRIIFSEGCVEYSNADKNNQTGNAEHYAHDIIGNLNAGLDTFIDWNLVLDKDGGPNHVGNNCDAPIMCDTDNGTWWKNLSYHYIGHFSKFIRPGAVRIGFSRYTELLETTAFINTDGEIGVVMLNRNDDELPVILRLENQICKIDLPSHSISTALIR